VDELPIGHLMRIQPKEPPARQGLLKHPLYMLDPIVFKAIQDK
jgi:hypothetical protein